MNVSTQSIADEKREQIELLKEQWKKDPCWDIEDTNGFEEFHDQLLDWRKEYEAQCERERQHALKDRVEKVAIETGVKDAWIAKDLRTFSEIANDIDFLSRHTDQVEVSAMHSQVHATLLLAAQMKRIADTLEEWRTDQASDQDLDFSTRLYNIK